MLNQRTGVTQSSAGWAYCRLASASRVSSITPSAATESRYTPAN